VTPQPNERESIAAIWCREIAQSIADALHTTYTDARYRLVLRDVPAPRRLHAEFRTAGHQIIIVVHWFDLSQPPSFHLRLDDRDVALRDDHRGCPQALLAHAAWQAIIDAEHPATAGPASWADGRS
jgi:hypothetical protein